MRGIAHRSVCVSIAFFAIAADARADDAKIEASMICDRAPEPGRVRCFVELRLPQERTISWADVVIEKVPDFVTPLKGRLGPEDATAREGSRVRWAFGIVAKKNGQGEARARVRLVHCEGTKCVPATADVKATISVGT